MSKFLITLAGHSGGGLRNYLALANSSQGQYFDLSGNSVLKVQFSGAPANYFDMLQVAENSGVGEIKMQNNSGDTVGNVLGANGSVLQAIWSAGHIFHLFEPSIEMPTFIRNVTGIEKIELKSPHSNYVCILSNCNSYQGDNSILKINLQ
jgi:hypothetical protein